MVDACVPPRVRVVQSVVYLTLGGTRVDAGIKEAVLGSIRQRLEGHDGKLTFCVIEPCRECASLLSQPLNKFSLSNTEETTDTPGSYQWTLKLGFCDRGRWCMDLKD